MNSQERQANTNEWIAKPLNRKGDLNSWISRMKQACPNPKLGEIVWLNNEKNSTGYKVIAFRGSGKVIWQRGQVIWH